MKKEMNQKEQSQKEELAKKLQEYSLIEEKIQKKWEESKIWEMDAPKENEEKPPKFMATFPFPYTNGRLHLGHIFTVTKAEFAVRVERMKGKRAIFPFGYHCTGMPIKACADKLTNEIEVYGNPPKFPPKPTQEEIVEKKVEKKDDKKGKSNKSKANAKTIDAFQWEIMLSMDVPENEIQEFVNTDKWITYFPKWATVDLKSIGACIDWRRTFITTDKNPFFDQFVRWHLTTLKNRGKVLFGKRYTIWSPKDGQACMDHERASGEGVGPQEYTLVKLKVLEFNEALSQVPESKRDKVFFVAATLRPETMFGQTNCWVLPTGEYGVYQMKNGDIFVCSEWSARNMAFQEMFEEEGKVNLLFKVSGEKLIGVPLKAPLTKYEKIYTLPMLSISMTKGTGIVTSVPSDSPDDFVNIREFKNKPAFREKFGIKDEWIFPFETVPIIHTPGIGNTPAQTVVEELDIKTPGEKEKLEEAKEKVYKEGFYKGKFLVKEYEDKLVFEVKPIIRKKLIDEGHAIAYSEPEKQVMSRSGDVCVVALADQWYITYGEENWRKQVEGHLKNVKTFNPKVKTLFEVTLSWLNSWACSRSFGLGTKLPWDPQFLIESLSDSTIYMSYYTIAHLLHSDIEGSKPSTYGIKSEQMTPEVFDYIFLSGGEGPKPNTQIPAEALEHMRREFEYWYPVDLRVSGKDLIQNHLTFFLYNHSAIFPEKHWPQGIRANGHVLLNDKKMSKSTGNFLTLSQAVTQFTADGTRFTLAEAGDDITDANFKTDTANKRVSDLYHEIKWIEETLQQIEKGEFRGGELDHWFDKVFDAEIDRAIEKTIKHYENTDYCFAVNASWHGLSKSRDEYRKALGNKMNKNLILRYIETIALINSPIIPHFSERTWELLGKKGLIVEQLFPTPKKYDKILVKSKIHLFEFVSELRASQNKTGKGKKKLRVIVATAYPDYLSRSMEIIRSHYDLEGKKLTSDKKDILNAIYEDEIVKPHKKDLVKFIPSVLQKLGEGSGQNEILCKITFDELALFKENEKYILNELKIESLELVTIEDPNTAKLTPPCKTLQSTRPYNPQHVWMN
eukprot:TRINITY_DN6527_c0_g1_i2.p1 TRINITY_DN6527_c0_g1~~TRINITY_DN6527_c0_g1_i2.p1  ORF type:complete len:1070 (-),score=405.94 TRINITY_DN6527_c0_g1_i2:34-3243(-)